VTQTMPPRTTRRKVRTVVTSRRAMCGPETGSPRSGGDGFISLALACRGRPQCESARCGSQCP
jgi:hypothetical protein